MLEAITVKNFQGYKKAVILFHEGVNVIVGESDHGKSAIFKALRWVIYNKPSGDDFISYWSDTGMSVKVRVDGKSVTRAKGKENAYYIDKEKYLSFGVGVPEEVEKLFNMADVNIQNQLDTHFLLSESPGEVARYFNKIVDLDIIDRSMRNIQKQLKSEQQGLLNSKSEKASFEEDLKTYDWLMTAEDQLRGMENLSRTISKTSTQIKEITDLLIDIQSIETNRAPLNKLLSAQEAVKDMSDLSDDIKITKGKIEDIDQLLEELTETFLLTKLKTDLKKAEPEVTSLMTLTKDIGLRRTECLELSNIISTIKTITNNIERYEKEKEQLQKDFTKLMPNTCPLCEQEIIK